MTVKITEECMGCGSCETVCPFGAIGMQSGKAMISGICMQCGACIDICSVGAILRE